MRAKLLYPSFRYDDPPVAECEVEIRLTPKMVVVTGLVPGSIFYLNGKTRGPTGIRHCRFWRETGRKVGGYSLSRSWYLPGDELQRLNAIAKGGGA